tara:strand:+ start:50979 stop:52106 length:1128 start_codon:yes stop_codon:yes gene_type:complete
MTTLRVVTLEDLEKIEAGLAKFYETGKKGFAFQKFVSYVTEVWPDADDATTFKELCLMESDVRPDVYLTDLCRQYLRYDEAVYQFLHSLTSSFVQHYVRKNFLGMSYDKKRPLNHEEAHKYIMGAEAETDAEELALESIFVGYTQLGTALRDSFVENADFQDWTFNDFQAASEQPIEVTADHFDELHAILTKYVDPENKDGFRQKFILAVIKEWSGAEYVESDFRDTGYDKSTYAKRTGEPLKDNITTYLEFFESNTGLDVPTFESGSGMRTETREEFVAGVFGDATQRVMETYVKDNHLITPEGCDEECPIQAMGMEEYDRKTHTDLADSADLVNCEFNCYGYGQMAYAACEGDGNEGYFDTWTLDDFKKAAVV